MKFAKEEITKKFVSHLWKNFDVHYRWALPTFTLLPVTVYTVSG